MNLLDRAKKVYSFNVYNRECWVADQASQIPDHSKVLDVGAGTGQYRSLFDHCDYYTHDFGQTPDLMDRYIELDYQSDILNIPVPTASFDVILCTEVLEHVPEPIEAIREMSRILKKGGKLLLTAPLGAFLHQEPYHYYGGFTPYWYQKFFAGSGLKIKCIVPNKGFFSLFGQETMRFSILIHPRNSASQGFFVRVLLTVLWVVTFPLLYIFLPLIGSWLDHLQLEKIATIGYHILATKE